MATTLQAYSKEEVHSVSRVLSVKGLSLLNIRGVRQRTHVQVSRQHLGYEVQNMLNKFTRRQLPRVSTQET